MSATNPSVAAYVAQRLSDLGIEHVFGVPGDYAFSFDDAVELCPNLKWIASANELNAAYEADGYARIRGAAILTTTYGVGELSAINGVMGSLAHRLPVFHVVGAPSRRIVVQKLLTHHSLGDGVYGNFEQISAAACCVSTFLTPENTIREMERVIDEALGQSKPAYIVVSEDFGNMPVIGTPIKGKPLSQIIRRVPIQAEVDAAVQAIIKVLEQSSNAVALPSAFVQRFGLGNELKAFLAKSKLSYAITTMDKGVVGENDPAFLGVYNGVNSYPSSVKKTVESADVVLDIGGVILMDLNTGFWTSDLSEDKFIRIKDDSVQIGDRVWVGTTLQSVLQGLTDKIGPVKSPQPVDKPQALALDGQPDAPTSSSVFYPRLQRMLRSGDVLVSETGTCMLHLGRLQLPEGVGYEAQVLWGSIGWATPAAVGVAMANQAGRTVLVTGDGSHQLTYNEIGVMGRYNPNLVMFVLNNGIYGVEDVLSEMGHEYDDLARVNYHQIPEAMGCKGWITGRASTVAELDAFIARIQASKAPAYIEVMIPAAESQPVDKSIQENMYKLYTPKP
jgi:indolepyruvate decarboxylase